MKIAFDSQIFTMQASDGYLQRYNDITHELGFIEHSLAQVLLASGFKQFEFHGFEEFVFNTPLETVRRVIRILHWKSVRLLRWANGNINPRILNPVFYVVAYK